MALRHDFSLSVVKDAKTLLCECEENISLGENMVHNETAEWRTMVSTYGSC